MQEDKISLEEKDRRAQEYMTKELSEHLQLAYDANILLCETLNLSVAKPRDATQKSFSASALLLVRLFHDLRSVGMLVLRGFSLQSLTITSSMAEIAYTIAAIGNDEEFAEKWFRHDDPTRPFRSMKELIKKALKKQDIPDVEKQIEKAYLDYSQLCLAKHANPLFQKGFGYQLINEEIYFTNDPDTSERAIRSSWFAFEYAVTFALMGIHSFFINHMYIPFGQGEEFHQRGLNLTAKKDALHEKAIARWGTENPFPGKW